MVRETRHLWVGNLPETVCEEKIRDHFKRYGRVQSVKILLSSAFHPNLLLPKSPHYGHIKDQQINDNLDVSSLLPSGGGVTTPSVNCGSSVSSNSSSNSSTTSNNNNNNNNNSSNNNTISSNITSNSTTMCTAATLANYNAGSVCATVAFIDIKSASKAHTAENKFDDRLLTTEYYEPSSIPSTSGENSPSSNCSSGTQSSQHLLSSQQQLIKINSKQPSISTTVNDKSVALPAQYSAVATPQTAVVPSTQLSTVTVPTRFPTPNHGSSEDLSPVFGDRSTFYDRVPRVNDTSDQYARRSNNYHSSSGDSRGRTRDRYRNGLYSSTIERSNPITLHRISSSSWHENSNPSPTARSVYGNMASAVVTPDGSYDPTLDRRMSETDVSVKSSSISKKKSRSGSESPCGGSTSSRSHSRSPSSCSSTNSASSNSNETGSPVSGSDPSRSRHLQSAVSTPATNSSNSNPAVHSEDNRPLAICVRNLPSRSSDTSLKDGLFHEYKKHGKVTWVKVVGQSSERYALVCFKKADDVDKALEVSHDKLFFGCKIEVEPYQGFDVEDNEFRPYEAELDEYHPKSTRTLFIGNLEKDITASELRRHFDCFGEIIEIDIKKQGVNAYAFCQYSDIISVVKAMRKMDGEHLGSNRIKLGFGKSMPTNCVWIDGISDNVSENYLTTQFNRFGLVSQVATDRERKLALVFFEQIQYAQTAVKEMRGVTLRGRKLQVDFASRECQDAFYDKLEKQSGGVGTIERANTVAFEAGRDASARGFEATTVVPGTRFNRYENATSRSRASSFSRHSASGATSPSSIVGNTTPRGSRRGRYVEYQDGDTIERRLKSYDEYSQGSGASHEDDSYTYTRDRPDSPLSRLGAAGSIAGDLDTVPVRRRSEKSPASTCGAEDEYFSSNVIGSGKHRVQSVVVTATESQSTGLFPPPGDIRHLQKERYHLLEQLEECPSSGDELVSPYKRMKFDQSIDSISSVQTNLISDSNCDLILNHANESNLLLMHHRKSVEVRRLSDSNSLKHITVNINRRPSTDNTISRHSRDPHDHVINVYTPHAVCKRRKTGNSMSESEHHSSRGRGHQLHSHHSHEASGGESADGSRPGTPLCDERPEILPSEPRRLPRDRQPNSEPMYLPLPKFAIQLYHQNRLFTSHSSLSTGNVSSHTTTVASLANHTSLNSLSSPPPALLTRPTTQNNISLQSTQYLQQQQQQQSQQLSSSQSQHHSHHYNQSHSQSSIEQPPASPSRALSLSSYSSDSDMAPSSSPSIEERIKTLDEMFEKWSGGNTNRTHTFSDASSNTSAGNNFASARHKFLDLDVNEVQPSDILKSVLAKPSIFDDDSKRLENIGDKYEPREFSNLPRSSLMSSFQGVIASPATQATVAQSQTSTSSNSSTITKPQPLVFQAPSVNQVHQRINSSPMNSPQPMSPYNSPSPTPTLVATSQKLNCVQSVAAAAKGLQYPFPSHPPVATPPIPTATPPAIPPTPPPPATECTGPTTSVPLTSVSTSTTLTDIVATTSESQRCASVTATSVTTSSIPSGTATSTPVKSKNNISKSISLQEKWSGSTQSTNNRNLSKSVSVPGSTNVGTVKTLSVSKDDENTSPTLPTTSITSTTTATSTTTTTSAATISKKEAKALRTSSKSSGKRNSSKNDNERKRRNDSLDRRKNHDSVNHKEQPSSDEQLQQQDSVEVLQKEVSSGAEDRLQTDREKISAEAREREQREKEEELRLKQREEERREQERLENECKEKEERIRREAEEKERKERERVDAERRQREELERRQREELERRHRDELEKQQREEAIRREREESERLEKEKLVLEEKLRQAELDEEENRSKREEILKLEDVSDVEIDTSHELNDYSPSKTLTAEQQSSKVLKDHHNKENARISRENTPFFDTSKRRERVNSGSSPVRTNSKRRISDPDSDDGEESKRFKNNSISSDNRKILDRRDFKDPNRSSDKSKHHRHHSKSSSLQPKSGDDSRFDDRNRYDDQRRKDHDHDRHRSKDRQEKHKSRKNKEEKEISNHISDSMETNDNRLSPDKCYLDQDGRSSDDEHKKRDKKKSDGIGGLLDDSNYRQYGSGENKSSRDDKKYNRHNSGDRRGRNDDGNGSHNSNHTSSSKSSSERRSRLRKQNANSSDDSDSDEPKKHSIFDIPDDGPAYISMYDKVKARSCKNMQKQEEEKKIKAKFSQLKQCRERKREEKKRSNSWDDDSDSDIDVDRRNMKSKSKGFINTSSDEDGRQSRNHKDHFMSDTESEPRRSSSNYHRNRLNELCDGESSENSLRNNKPRRKITSRKNSRSTRIASDTSDDDGGVLGEDDTKPIIDKIKLEPIESHCELDAVVKEELSPIKVETVPRIEKDVKPDIKMEIKSETKEEPTTDSFDFSLNYLPSKPSDAKDSIFDILSSEPRKKHKKNKKRQKSLPSSGADGSNQDLTLTESSIKQEKSLTETVFDELKREPTHQMVFHEKRRHSSRKDKKRDKSKEEHERSKEERYRLKKLKKQAKLSSDSSVFDSQETNTSNVTSTKRGEKMEDIFGPISDDDSHISHVETAKPNDSSNTSSTNYTLTNKDNVPTMSLISQMSAEVVAEVKPSLNEKESHRERKKEKKRKDRMKVAPFDENSVDLDAAGRALEAQLMADSDIKTEEISQSSSIAHPKPSTESTDVFRFSDGDDVEIVVPEKKSEHSDSHRSKEKKKKKKRSKDEKHQRHHHHSSSHSNSLMSPPTTPSTPILTIDITGPDTAKEDSTPLSKQSPSLPCLLDDIPPFASPREQKLISPIPKTPTTTVSSTSKLQLETRKEPKNLIPGFGLDCDEKIHESAVQSISTEYSSPKAPVTPEVTDEPKPDPQEETDAPKTDEKTDEKSRVIISQEETEDAVAALLGESFGSSADYGPLYEADPIVEEEVQPAVTSESVIPEEEAEEMRKAVQSLNSEELDMKPDTPQSDNDLQIDTDTEDQDNEAANAWGMDRPKTPDVDLSQIQKTDVEKPNVSLTSLTKSVATPTTVTASTTVITKTVQAESKMPSLATIPAASTSETPDTKAIVSPTIKHPETNSKPTIVESRVVAPSVSSSVVLQQAQPQIQKPATVRPRNIITTAKSQQQLIFTTQPRMPNSVSAPGSPRQQPPRQAVASINAIQQPTTISIPEKQYYQPMVMVSPRATEPRSQSPRQSQPQQFTQVVKSVTSPTIIRQQSPRPSNTTHVVVQQRQIMSPTSSQQKPVQPTVVMSSSPNITTNIVLNRLAVTPVLAPISSKPQQSTSVVLPQPNVAQPSHNLSSTKPVSISISSPNFNKSVVTQANSEGQQHQNHIYSTVRVNQILPPSTQSTIQVGGKVVQPQQHVQQSPNISMPSSQSKPVVVDNKTQKSVIEQRVQFKGQNVISIGTPQQTQQRNLPPQLQQQQYKNQPPQQIQTKPTHQVIQQQTPAMKQQTQPQTVTQHSSQIVQYQQQQNQQPKVQQHWLQKRTVPMSVPQSQVFVQQQSPISNKQVQVSTTYVHQPSTQSQQLQYNQPMTVGPRAQIRPQIQIVNKSKPVGIVVQNQQMSPIQSHQHRQPQITQQAQLPSQQQPQIVYQQIQQQNLQHTPTKRNIQSDNSNTPSTAVLRREPYNSQVTVSTEKSQPLPMIGSKPDQELTETRITPEPVVAVETKTETSESTVCTTAKPDDVPKQPDVKPAAESIETSSVIKMITTSEPSTSTTVKSVSPTEPPVQSLLTEENVTKLSNPNVEYQIEQDSKEDSDYWSAKEVNIDSVIKKVDALCSADRESIPTVDLDKASEETVATPKSDDNLSDHADKMEKDEDDYDEGVGNLDSKVLSNDDRKTIKKARSARGGRKSLSEHIKASTGSEENVASPDPAPSSVQASGVQTRRGGPKANAKRSRGGRVSTSKPSGSTRQAQPATVSERMSKPRNQNSESDIYEFHEDSGEEAAIVPETTETTIKPVDGNRPRLILTINKGQGAVQAVTQTTVASTVAQPAVLPEEPPKPTVTPVSVVVSSSANTTTNTISSPVQSNIANANVQTVQQPDAVNKDDFTAPQIAASLRKSRRLLERDGSRSTVDDIIEDVVKNLPPEQKALLPNQSSGMTPPRRSTRNTSQTGGKQQITPEKTVGVVDVRKSPRANRRTKDRKDSYTSADSSDEKSRTDEKKGTHEISESVHDNKIEAAKDSKPTDVSESDEAMEKETKAVEVVKKVEELETKVEPISTSKATVSTEPAIEFSSAVKKIEEPSPEPIIKLEKKNNEKSMVLSKSESAVELDPVTGILTVVQEGQATAAPVVVKEPPPTPKPSAIATKEIIPAKVILDPVTPISSKVSSPIPAIPVSSAPITISAIKTTQVVAAPPQPMISKPPQPTIVTTQSAIVPLGTTIVPKQQISPHPLKSRVLNATVQMNKPVLQPNPNILKAGSGATISPLPNAANSQQVIMTNAIVGPSNQLQTLQQMSVHTTNLPRTGSPIVNQHTHNLQVNVQSRGTPSPIGSAHSPRIQTMTQQKIVHQQPTLQTIHVQQKQHHPSTIISQSPSIQHHQQQIIHAGKIQSGLQALPMSGYPNVVASGAKHAPPQQHVVKHHPGPIQLQHSNIHPQQKHQLNQAVVTQQHTTGTKQTVQSSNQLPLIHQQQSNKIHQQTIQQAGASQHIMLCASSNVVQQIQQQQSPSISKSGSHHQIPPTGGKSVIGLHQVPQIMTGAVASPPLKQSHLNSQQPIVTGASSSRVSVPPISPQGQRTHVLQPGLPVPAFEANLGDGTFSSVPIRRDYFMYQDRYGNVMGHAGHGSRISSYIRRSPILPGSAEHKDVADIDEPLGTSPPLELRRPTSAPRATIAIPHSLQSPQDRDSPQAAQVYGTRIPHPAHFPADVRFFDNSRAITGTEPPPAHRSHGVVTPSPASSYTTQSSSQSIGIVLPHAHDKSIDQRERDKERSSIPGKMRRPGSMPSHGSLVPAMATPTGRILQVATPPHASQVPPQADSLLMLLQRYPVMWQGLLALKTDQAAVQMHFVFGNPNVASDSLPCNSDGSTPPLRIAQRMRLEQTQLEGVARKMQTVNEHCMLLALPCGRDHMDVLQQSTNLQTGFITYLQQKQAAGIVNIPAPGSEQAAYVVHIFPSCEFANENLARIAPDLLHRVADIAHLLIVIATV
ncbi:protein split ends isoform X3 [Bradysia coprophila]|uniref:protein split ends isoform X3 n=1 Tax=Bradysia coprophila TaxID=38358 RepID=UPI00187D8417|nr:protein split ends isoform X3 [Bradysia coprophila]